LGFGCIEELEIAVCEHVSKLEQSSIERKVGRYMGTWVYRYIGMNVERPR